MMSGLTKENEFVCEEWYAYMPCRMTDGRLAWLRWVEMDAAGVRSFSSLPRGPWWDVVRYFPSGVVNKITSQS